MHGAGVTEGILPSTKSVSQRHAPENDRAIGNEHRNFGEIWRYGFITMQADRQTNTHSRHNTLVSHCR